MVTRNGSKVDDAQQYWLDTFNVGDSWRLFRIMAEFVEGFDSLAVVKTPAVSIFGSARFEEDHEYYKVARAVGKGLSEAGYAIMTGGGPGIMEAGNRGAADAVRRLLHLRGTQDHRLHPERSQRLGSLFCALL